MAQRATEPDEDASLRSNGISSLDRVFRAARSCAELGRNLLTFPTLRTANEPRK
jgi:hypothetical protein